MRVFEPTFLDEPPASDARDAAFDEDRDAAALGRGQPGFQGVFALLAAEFEDVAEAFFE